MPTMDSTTEVDTTAVVDSTSPKSPEKKSDYILGIIARNSSTVSQSQLLRFQRQAVARQLLPGERVANCLRKLAPTKETVDVMFVPEGKRSYFANLLLCKSVWACPCCGGRITEERRHELTLALAKLVADGKYWPLLITLTLRHKKDNSLVEVERALKRGYAALTSGRSWVNFKADYGWLGQIRSTEVTYGDNGWHPHYHVLAVLERSKVSGQDLRDAADDISRWLKNRWMQTLEKQGFDASWEHGVDVTDADTAIAEYVTKYGHEPENIGWTVEAELTKAPVKQASAKGYTPHQLLDLTLAGESWAGDRFVEFYFAMKGAHQLEWSPVLRKLLDLGAEPEESDLADETDENAVVLAALDREQWGRILHYPVVTDDGEFVLDKRGKHVTKDLRPDLLAVAAMGNAAELLRWLDLRGIMPAIKVNATDFMWEQYERKHHVRSTGNEEAPAAARRSQQGVRKGLRNHV